MLNRIVLLLSLLWATPGVASAKGLAGVGARPLAPTVAATYFIEAVVPPHTYKMAAVIFLLGEPGWTKKKTNWTLGPEDLAFSNFEFPSGTFRVELAVSERIISVVGEEVDSTVFNVLVVSGVPTAEARIVHREKLDLSVPFESDPVREVLQQFEALRKTLGLE